MVKRLFDFSLALTMSILLAPLVLMIAVLLKLTSSGPVLYWSDRIGKNNAVFKMPKFRTMKTDTPAVATHLLSNPDNYLTAVGKFLRLSSLDELPQMISILQGYMSFVGPRPALFNQDDLISLRTERKVHQILPGLTGWAQINGRDDLPIPVKVAFDEFYLHHRSFLFDLKIIMMTFVKVARREGVTY